jgi:4-hydroxythreonine-4-phosphate dehydrogenase
MNKIKIGITVGDINGIGLEVILKTLANSYLRNFCIPIIYGSSKVVAYHKNIVDVDDFHFQSQVSADRVHKDKVNVINCWEDTVDIQLGRCCEEGGKYAFRSLQWATADLKVGLIDALVTAPINKKAMQLAQFPFPGHTEYLSQELEGNSLMLMVNDSLRIGVVTNHIPLKAVGAKITKKLVISKLRSMSQSLKIDFGIERPLIAVLALNPHASDDGVIGDEEEKIIRPAIIECKKHGMMAMGPFPADGFFGSGEFKKYDGIMAMYHDQGLIPFKTLSFGNGVNFTAGLSRIRTSPDHGTGFDIVGKNMADPSSFRQALFSALDIVRNRNMYYETRENPLEQHEVKGEDTDPKELAES